MFTNAQSVALHYRCRPIRVNTWTGIILHLVTLFTAHSKPGHTRAPLRAQLRSMFTEVYLFSKYIIHSRTYSRMRLLLLFAYSVTTTTTQTRNLQTRATFNYVFMLPSNACRALMCARVVAPFSSYCWSTTGIRMRGVKSIIPTSCPPPPNTNTQTHTHSSLISNGKWNIQWIAFLDVYHCTDTIKRLPPPSPHRFREAHLI